jgi:hypothetical protein
MSTSGGHDVIGLVWNRNPRFHVSPPVRSVNSAPSLGYVKRLEPT